MFFFSVKVLFRLFYVAFLKIRDMVMRIFGQKKARRVGTCRAVVLRKPKSQIQKVLPFSVGQTVEQNWPRCLACRTRAAAHPAKKKSPPRPR